MIPLQELPEVRQHLQSRTADHGWVVVETQFPTDWRVAEVWVLRSAWGSPQYGIASRFFEEVPEELLDWRRAGSSPSSTPAIAAVAARPTARSPGNRPVVELAVGDRVSHDTFGLGTVVATAGVAERAEATIDFGTGGVKRLLLRYAPVEKL